MLDEGKQPMVLGIGLSLRVLMLLDCEHHKNFSVSDSPLHGKGCLELSGVRNFPFPTWDARVE